MLDLGGALLGRVRVLLEGDADLACLGQRLALESVAEDLWEGDAQRLEAELGAYAAVEELAATLQG